MALSKLSKEEIFAKAMKLPALNARNLKNFQESLLDWYNKNKEMYPWRIANFTKDKPYQVWISEIMLQQTLLQAVIPKYINFIRQFPTVIDLANAEEKQVKFYCSGLGYYSRFKNMFIAARQIVENYSNNNSICWPTKKEDWLKLPGVGEYTASAVTSICFQQPHAVVDANVERVLSRFFDIALPTNFLGLKKFFRFHSQILLKKSQPGDFNQGMMELGQKICQIANPRCMECPVRKYCLAFKNKTQNVVPIKKEKKILNEIHLILNIHERDKFIFLSDRVENTIFLKGIPGFPLKKITPIQLAKRKNQAMGLKSKTKEGRTMDFTHNITNNKISVLVQKHFSQPKEMGKWIKKSSVLDHIVSTLDRKAWNIYIAKTDK